MLKRNLRAGSDSVELGHGIRQSLWEGIAQFFADHPMKVGRGYNYCRFPSRDRGSAPDCYQVRLSARTKRDRAPHYPATIDYEHRIGAKRVVIAPARLQFLIHRAAISLHFRRPISRSPYVRLKLAAIRKRDAVAAYDRVVEWLPNLRWPTRTRDGVTMGVENRIGIETFRPSGNFVVFRELGDKHARLPGMISGKPRSSQFDLD